MGIVKNEMISIKEYLEHGNLNIPEFQRPYKWTAKNVTQLLDDINPLKNKKRDSYLIGTVVIFKDDKDEVFQIVDGQQRTITFLLILKALIKRGEIKDVGLKKELCDLHEKCFNPSFNNDISKKNIHDNYITIVRRIDSIDDEYIEFFLNQCKVTFFVIDDISEAFQFFDSQNARGKDLEPHDLLKAFHLREFSNETSGIEKTTIVEEWEKMDTDQLSELFADFLFRVRLWSKGDSSRYFTKKDIGLFKGINFQRIDEYPYMLLFKYLTNYVNEGGDRKFPFQLDQVIINGEYFFKMISYYKQLHDKVIVEKEGLNGKTSEIVGVIDNYEGMNRTGDKYVRMLFNCALLFYCDKFGLKNLDIAVEKIFIWAYTIRLSYQTLQLVSVDNYVVREMNMFKLIKEATYSHEIGVLELPMVKDGFESGKTKAIKDLFIKMNYYVVK